MSAQDVTGNIRVYTRASYLNRKLFDSLATVTASHNPSQDHTQILTKKTRIVTQKLIKGLVLNPGEKLLIFDINSKSKSPPSVQATLFVTHLRSQ